MRTTATVHPSQSARKLFARFVIFVSVMFTVPVSPRTASWAPCQPRKPASVTTKDGIASHVTIVPGRAR